jgi:hypothetical protein
MTADVGAAAAWGGPCSIFPLGKELHYAWLARQRDWWPIELEGTEGKAVPTLLAR